MCYSAHSSNAYLIFEFVCTHCVINATLKPELIIGFYLIVVKVNALILLC